MVAARYFAGNFSVKGAFRGSMGMWPLRSRAWLTAIGKQGVLSGQSSCLFIRVGRTVMRVV
jgi:hypothetical protein